jgi:Spy/CpxP family protein refolding chaperone
MTRFRLLTLGAVMAGIVAVGAAVQAQGPMPGGPGGPGRHFGHRDGLPLVALNLTDAQKQQVGDIREKHRANLQAAGQQLRQAFTAQRAAMQATPADEGQVRSTTVAVATAQAAIAVERAQIRNEVFSILTPEQQDKVKQLQADREARMKQRMQKRQG